MFWMKSINTSVLNPIVGVTYAKQADYTRGDNSENEQKKTTKLINKTKSKLRQSY